MSNAIGNTKKKEGVNLLVIDNTDNTDSQLSNHDIEMELMSRRPKLTVPVLILGSGDDKKKSEAPAMIRSSTECQFKNNSSMVFYQPQVVELSSNIEPQQRVTDQTQCHCGLDPQSETHYG
ncbi:MAG: hypothetical protein FWD27_02690 [Coriobacteriia bacterium]|nr:hypothetical protein [Coriobacteriia bacterium]